jgi:hypothetical protein
MSLRTYQYEVNGFTAKKDEAKKMAPPRPGERISP